MKGLGTYVRSLIFDAYRATVGRDAFLNALAPDYFEFRRIQLMFIASRERHYLYVTNPKVASTTVRNRLRELNGYPPLDDPRDVMGHKGSGFWMPKTMTRNELKEVCSSPRFFRFSFVRNPFDRVVSAYAYFQEGIESRSESADHKPRILRAADPKRDEKTWKAMDFPGFVRAICADASYVQDQHWRTQTDLLKLGLIAYDFIGKMERFGDDMTRVLERLEAPDDVKARADQKTNQSKRRTPVAGLFDERSAELVRQKFAEDFRNFDYPLDLPG
jgi:hypothetical protein